LAPPGVSPSRPPATGGGDARIAATPIRGQQAKVSGLQAISGPLLLSTGAPLGT
jgi:hypothetical protein